MEFVGFILGFALAAASLMGGVFTIVDFRRRRPRRWMSLGFAVMSLAATASLAARLHHVDWLDERLFIAAAEGDLPKVRALLASGACPDATWEDGTSALAAARRAGHAEVAAALRRAGAAEPPSSSAWIDRRSFAGA